MSLLTLIPPYNPIKFFPQTVNADARYNFTTDNAYKPYEQFSYDNAVMDFQYHGKYIQKWQNNDVIQLQIHTQINSGTHPPKLAIYDYNGTLIAGNIGATDGVTNPNNYYTDQFGNKTYLTTSCWKLNSTNFGWFGSLNGWYYFVISNTDDYANTIYYQSEYQFFFPLHKGTGLIQYSNNTNKPYFIVDGLNSQNFSLRCECDVREPKHKAAVTSYINQDYDRVSLNKIQFPTWQLQVGRNGRFVSEYIINTVSEILMCDNIAINGKNFVLDLASGQSEDVLSIKSSAYYPLKSASANLREVRRTDSYAFYRGTTIAMWPALYNTSGDYAVGMSQFNVNGNLFYLNPAMFHSHTDETNFITYLNTSYAAYAGLSGTFSITSGYFIYTQAAGETVYYSVPIVYPKFLRLGLTINVLTTTQTYSLTLNGGSCVIDWGDTAHPTEYANTGLLNTHTYTSGSPISATYNIYIFHCDTITDISATQYTASQVYVGLAYGVAPKTLNSFVLYGNFGAGTSPFNDAILTPCINNLTLLDLRVRCGGFASGHLFSATNAFKLLKTIYLNNNYLTSTDVDNVFNDFDQYCLHPLHGLITTKYQLPSGAPPTIASAIARTDLSLAGYTIFTD